MKLIAPTVNVTPIPIIVDPERQSSSMGTIASLQKEQDMALTIGPHISMEGLGTHPMYSTALIQFLRYLLIVSRKANLSTQCPNTLLSRKNIITAVTLVG